MNTGKSPRPLEHMLMHLQFAMGIPRVGICHTVTVPSDITPMQGTGRNQPLIYVVSCKTHSNTVNHGILIKKINYYYNKVVSKNIEDGGIPPDDYCCPSSLSKKTTNNLNQGQGVLLLL